MTVVDNFLMSRLVGANDDAAAAQNSWINLYNWPEKKANQRHNTLNATRLCERCWCWHCYPFSSPFTASIYSSWKGHSEHDKASCRKSETRDELGDVEWPPQSPGLIIVNHLWDAGTAGDLLHECASDNSAEMMRCKDTEHQGEFQMGSFQHLGELMSPSRKEAVLRPMGGTTRQ